MAKKQRDDIGPRPSGEPGPESPQARGPGAVLRPPAEALEAEELRALAEADADPRPPGGSSRPARCGRSSAAASGPAVRRKFFGDDAMVERAIVSLSSNRGLMLVGEPGTAKSMLSELLAAAISGTSINAIQGTAGTTEDHIKYSWNYALLLAEGPTPRARWPRRSTSPCARA